MTTTVGLLDAICVHLTEFELPAIFSLHVAASIPAPHMTVQLACHQPPQIARALLAWTDTFTEVTAEAWRVPQGDSVHLPVRGRLPGGASIRVYGATRAITGRDIGTDLAPDAATTITLTALRHATTPGKATA